MHALFLNNLWIWKCLFSNIALNHWSGYEMDIFYYYCYYLFLLPVFFIVDLIKPFSEVIPIVIANNQAWTESVFAVPKILKVLFLSIPRHYSFIITRTPKSKANYDDPDDAISWLLVAFGTANRNLPYWGVRNAL